MHTDFKRSLSTQYPRVETSRLWSGLKTRTNVKWLKKMGAYGLKLQYYAHLITCNSSWGRALLLKRREDFRPIFCGFWKKSLWDQGRRMTWSHLALPLAGISIVLSFIKEPQCISSLEWQDEKLLPSMFDSSQELRSEFSSELEREKRKDKGWM